MKEKEAKFTILGVSECEPCEELKEKLGNSVNFIDINSEEGREIIEAGKLPVSEDNKLKIPLAMNEEGQFCELYIDDDYVIAVCGDEQRVLYEKEEETVGG